LNKHKSKGLKSKGAIDKFVKKFLIIRKPTSEINNLRYRLVPRGKGSDAAAGLRLPLRPDHLCFPGNFQSVVEEVNSNN
jgi:hypothetical protein